ncbi:uncharacterized protein GLRG_09276 [Colletotrichum graminicola M1.001]|uniref:Uncharacterized protein n=1 Tax=Colletotrichum graminicola (strain M1.001 / M2 / FGSC 10212) TaxID=645133 RepID=E3QTE4_COLGM|nr:uncharacterized protein GLRG_09276 [Colletotrichum graminicola M1.001]EFQ34132.1 hypothetical protein GLRG_09276 [Colletotrichum graminicola M1.001]
MAFRPKTNSGKGSRPVSRQTHSDNTPPQTPNQVHRVPSTVRSRFRTSSKESSESGRSTPFSGILRRSHPRPTPIDVSRPTDETPSPTATVESAPLPPLPTPLLAGCPGREISGAKSDGRILTCDFDEPPVLECSDDLSRTKFHEHPLVQHIELEKGWEKHQLALYGLILPAKIDNGAPTYTWDSDPEDEQEADKNKAFGIAKDAKTPSKPHTPSERPRTPSNILHKVKSFANYVAASEVEKEVPELPTLKELLDQFGLPPATPTEYAPGALLRPTRSSSSLRPKTPLRSVPSATKLRAKRSTGIDKSQISDPVVPEEMRRVGADFSQVMIQRGGAANGERSSPYGVPVRSPSNLISSSMSSNLPVYLLQPQHPSVYSGRNEAPPKFRLASPRLSPMEYARQYLIAKARADKEGVECAMSKPALVWTWTAEYKEFLLLPHIPKGIQRGFLPDNGKDWKKSDFLKSASAANGSNSKTCLLAPLPLKLTPSSPLLPAGFLRNSHSPTTPTHRRGLSIDSFTLDQPAATEAHDLLQSTETLLEDPAASIPSQNNGLFVAVHIGSEIGRDEDNISPCNSECNDLPPAPVSPLTSSPASAQTQTFAPPHVTQMSGTYNTLDDAKTQQLTDKATSETHDGADFSDTSSVYSQDSVITVVHHPVAGHCHTPFGFMLQACAADEDGQEGLAPPQQENLSSDVPLSKAETLRPSPALPPLAYIPNTLSAYSYASSEQLHDNGNGRQSQAPSSFVSTASTPVNDSIADQHNRHSIDSHTSNGSQSRTSISTSTSRGSLPLVSAPTSQPGRSTTRKHVRSSRLMRPLPRAPSNPLHQKNNISRQPAKDSTVGSPSPSRGILLSNTSPSVNSTGLSRQHRLPKRPNSPQNDAVTKAIESLNTNLPSLQVRRRRPVNDLPYIPVSHCYPKPLKISEMKSPSPASTTPAGDRTSSGASTDTVVRSASTLITDVSAEVDREMEGVLSPRTAALAAQSKAAEKKDDIGTPTRRLPRPLRLPKPVPWSPPIYPPPNKPLPPVPQKKKAQLDAPLRKPVEPDYVSGPSSSRASAASRTSIITPAVAVTQAPAPPATVSTTDFYDPYPPPRVIWTDGDVTISDFSIPKRTVRPAASMTTMSPRQNALTIPGKHCPPESTASPQRGAPVTPSTPTPSPSRLLGKVASMNELRQRRLTDSSEDNGSDEAIGLKTFLLENAAPAPASAREKIDKGGVNGKPTTEGSRKKFFGKLFRRVRKDSEK